MNTRTHFCTNIVLGATLFAFSQLAWSLGLGEVQVDSFLGEPLEIRIELITRAGDDLDSVSAKLASAEDYQLIGASRDDVSVPLQFTIVGINDAPGGNVYIGVSSRLPLSNPVVRLILEVNWSRGRMLREYTLFLDPPTYRQAAPAPRVEMQETTAAKPVQAPRIDTQSPIEEPSTRVSETSSSSSAAPDANAYSSDSVVSGSDEYGPVQSGDTLWRIAKDWSDGSGLNLNKVMLAIQRENPQAFSNNNINLLQRGAILRMPDIGAVNSISSASASNEVSKQVDAFQLHKSANLAATDVPLISSESVVTEPARSIPSTERAIEQAAEATPEDNLLSPQSPAEAASEVTPSQLELLPPSENMSADRTSGFDDSESATDDAASALALREELSRKEEELINQRKQNEYLEQRLQELENQLALSREGTVEDENLAGMEERLRQERLTDEQSTVPKVTPAPRPDEPWYSRFSLWLLGLLVLAAVLAGWLMSRRGGSDTIVSDLGKDPGPLNDLKAKRSDDLAVASSVSMEDEPTETLSQEKTEQDVTASETEASAENKPELVQSIKARKTVAEDEEEAQLLDEESADPEIQLDLARAYISMGDREAARVILEEVIANGSEEQQAEANKMKDLL